MALFDKPTITACFEKPNGSIGLKAGESKTGGNEYPLINNMVEDSLVTKKEGFIIGNSILKVNGHDMKGKLGHDVHEIVRNTKVGAMLEFIIQPMGRSSTFGGPSRFSSTSSLGAFGIGAETSSAPAKERRPTFGDLDTGMFDATPEEGGEDAIEEDEELDL